VELHTALATKLESSLHHIPMELWDALDRCKGFEELKMCIVDYVSQLAHKITSNHSHYMIEKVKRLVETNYADNVTLLGIAETLSIHPVWLSQLFKRECGINFVDYLAEVRIEEAKKLLRKSELKIYEVVRAVGYADLQHFGQIFKKKTGMSPKEYRFGK
jgi:YesN/AraC family two-component response regulator